MRNYLGAIVLLGPCAAWPFQLFRTRHRLSTSTTTTTPIRDTVPELKTTLLLASESPEPGPYNRLNLLGFRHMAQDQQKVKERAAPVKVRYPVNTLPELEAYFNDEERRFRKSDSASDEIDYNSLLRALSVKGDTQIIGDANRPQYVHPVARLLHERRKRRSVGNEQGVRDDGCRVALSIEGGGMRGVVSAGMGVALYHLNLTDTFDVIYGSSAGSIAGAYFITKQLPWFGPEVYYDRLTTAGKGFIDSSRIVQALGFGMLDVRILKALLKQQHGKPVLNLDFLLKTTMQETKPLDWATFKERQKIQPLKVIASGVKSERAFCLDMESRAFETLAELGECMHASCLLPGIAGPITNMDIRAVQGQVPSPKYIRANNIQGDQFEPMADALIYEPLPYRTALAQGATHVVVLRSRPDGVDVTGKGGLIEQLIFRRFFRRKNKYPNVYKHLTTHMHKKIYAQDIIRLNEEASSQRDFVDTSRPHLMAVAVPPGSPEVTRLEVGREAILNGLRRGFARAYDCFVEDPSQRGQGVEVAKQVFPDDILNYDPLSIKETQEAAFAVYLRSQGISPEEFYPGYKRPEAAPQKVNV